MNALEQAKSLARDYNEAMGKLSIEDREALNKMLRDEKFEKSYARNKEKMEAGSVYPGIYNIIETDFGGMDYDIVAKLHITNTTNEYEIAKYLFNELGYISWWGYIEIRGTIEEVKPIYKLA